MCISFPKVLIAHKNNKLTDLYKKVFDGLGEFSNSEHLMNIMPSEDNNNILSAEEISNILKYEIDF